MRPCSSRSSSLVAAWRVALTSAVVVGLPVLAAAAAAPDLRTCRDPSLQASLEQTLQRLGLGPAVASRHLAVALVDLSTAQIRARLAMVNGDEMMYAASLPKIAILLGAFAQAERGQLVLDKATLASLTRMIRNSSNADATAMLERVGEQTLLEILTSQRYRFYDPATGGGLWVGKPYGRQPAYQRDPLHGLSHGATAYQVARFYYLLDRGELVAPGLASQMKAVLAEPAIHHKFVKGLESRPDTHLYRKSGTWRRYHSDSALVEGLHKRYILVGIADDPRGEQWLQGMAAPLDELVSH